MTLNSVTLILDLYDGSGAPLTQGTVLLTPSATLTDTTDNLDITQSPVQAQFSAYRPVPQVSLLATDNANLLPAGWGWTVTFQGMPGAPASFSFFLPFSGGATQYLSSMTPVSSVTAMQAYMPLPSGTATSGYVPVATGAGEASAWGPASGGGGAVSSVFTRTGAVVATSGDYAVGQVTGAAPLASPALTGTPTAPTKAALTNNTDIATTAYADAAVAVETTRAETAEALALPKTGGAMSGAIAMGSNKITGLANGSAAADAAAYGQTPAGGATVSLAQGGTGTSAGSANAAYNALSPMTTLGDIQYENSTPAAARLPGNTAATKNFLTQTGTGSVSAAPAWGTIAAGDVPILNQNTTGTAANITGTLDQVPAPTANWSNNSHKITSLANGSAAQDAAAFGQIPVADATTTDITLEGTQTAGSTGKWADGGHIHPAAVWTVADSGLLAWNCEPLSAGSSSLTTAGTLYLMRVNIYKAFTWTNVIISVPTNGSGTPGSGTFIGLYNSSGTLLSGSADVASSLTSTGAKTLALTSSQALSAGTFVWVALLTNMGTTQPTVSKSGASVGTANAGLTAASFRCAVNGTSLTALPGSITPSSNTGTGSLPFWVAAS
jgi:hypothetical protein